MIRAVLHFFSHALSRNEGLPLIWRERTGRYVAQHLCLECGRLTRRRPITAEVALRYAAEGRRGQAYGGPHHGL